MLLHSDTMTFNKNNVLWYIQNSKMECGTCKLYPFQLNSIQMSSMQIWWRNVTFNVKNVVF